MPDEHDYDFDLAVIGSGPAGQKAAIAAAKLGKRVVVIDREDMLGGVCLHTGTIPSKTLREAVLYLTGFRMRTFYGRDYAVKEHIRREDLMVRVDEVVRRERAVVHDALHRNQITMHAGLAKFVDPHTLEIEADGGTTTVTAAFILVACGTRPARPDDVPFTEGRVHDADELVRASSGELARSVIVVGGGVIGMEYASMATALGIEVTVVDTRDTLLEYVDREITDALTYHLRQEGMTFRLGEHVASIEVDDERELVTARLESGKVLTAERLFYAIGRQGNADGLRLETIGLEADKRGRLSVNASFQTDVPHVYAAGDIIGFPSLASTSMEQGRIAALHMFGVPFEHAPELLPYGIYTIPEISMVGRSEQQLTADPVPYEVGEARFEEVVKAQIIGDRIGFLKLIVHAEDRRILGVHVIGDGASELVHIGQAIMFAGGTVETLREMVFNYPTLAQAYKKAAMNVLNKLDRAKRA
jgi:NAD(P) transhydrogenase